VIEIIFSQILPLLIGPSFPCKSRRPGTDCAALFPQCPFTPELQSMNESPVNKGEESSSTFSLGWPFCSGGVGFSLLGKKKPRFEGKKLFLLPPLTVGLWIAIRLLDLLPPPHLTKVIFFPRCSPLSPFISRDADDVPRSTSNQHGLLVVCIGVPPPELASHEEKEVSPISVPPPPSVGPRSPSPFSP